MKAVGATGPTTVRDWRLGLEDMAGINTLTQNTSRA